MPTLAFIGTSELIFIALAVLLLFGSKRIPELARGLGVGIREFQKATNDIKQEIANAADTHVPNSSPASKKQEEHSNEPTTPDTDAKSNGNSPL